MKGGGLHHLCYEVPSIPEHLDRIRAGGGLIVSRPKPAVAFGGRAIAWALTPREAAAGIPASGRRPHDWISPDAHAAAKIAAIPRAEACGARRAHLPPAAAGLPAARPAARVLRSAGALNTIRWLLAVLIYEPLFRGRCSAAGKRLRITRMPFVIGPTSIHIGDDVNFFGKVDIASGYVCENPKLIIHDRVELGHNLLFVVNKLIEIESDVNVAGGVRFMDTDAHPRDMAARIADLPPGEDEVKPVRICRGAWIGQNAAILKGVTVGEGAIVSANSVVVTDVPPHTVAMGNPARVVVKNTPRAAS